MHKGSSGSSGIALPGNGMVTLYSGDLIPALPADTTANSITAPTPTDVIGELTLFADDFFDGVYLNGQPINIETRGSVRVNLLKGENVLAAKQVNAAWGGGMLASMLLPGNDTVRTDGTWKLTIKDPGEGWMNLNYADATWTAASEFGPVDVWPSFENWGLDAVNLYYQKARWISGATKTSFRKEMNFPYTDLRLTGNNFKFKLYIDGALVAQSDMFSKCPVPCQLSDLPPNQRIYVHSGITRGNRTFALELEDASTDGNGVLVKAFSGSGTPVTILDTTWKCWHQEIAGWNQPGFNDADWIHPGVVEAWDQYFNQLPFIYPTDFWYRKVFTSSEGTSGIIRINRIARPDGALPAAHHFNLRGQRMDVTTPAAAAAGGIILQRATDGTGQTRIKKGVMVTR